jgi:hypothetical protein
MFLTRPIAGARVASLSPRLLGDYLPGRLIWALRLAGVLALGAGIAGWFVSTGDGPDRFGGTVSSGASLGLGIAGAVLAIGVEALQRHVVGRSQPVVAADLLAADDAIRAASVHTLAGAGLAIELLAVSTVIARLVEAHPRLPAGLGASPFVVFIAGLAAWRYYSHRAWRVRRSSSTKPPTSVPQ